MSGELNKAHAYYLKAKQFAEAAAKVREEAKEALLEICRHPEVEAKDHHLAGSYYDRAQTYRVYTCTLCGTEVSRKLIYTGGYG